MSSQPHVAHNANTAKRLPTIVAMSRKAGAARSSVVIGFFAPLAALKCVKRALDARAG